MAKSGTLRLTLADALQDLSGPDLLASLALMAKSGTLRLTLADALRVNIGPGSIVFFVRVMNIGTDLHVFHVLEVKYGIHLALSACAKMDSNGTDLDAYSYVLQAKYQSTEYANALLISS